MQPGDYRQMDRIVGGNENGKREIGSLYKTIEGDLRAR